MGLQRVGHNWETFTFTFSPFPFGNHKFVFCVCESVSVLKIGSHSNLKNRKRQVHKVCLQEWVEDSVKHQYREEAIKLAKGQFLETLQTIQESSANHRRSRKRDTEETSLEVQWLRLCLPVQGAWVRSLVRELRSHTPHGQRTRTHTQQKQYCNKLRTLKRSTSKKKKKKEKRERDTGVRRV